MLRRLNGIEAARGIAALLVVIYHIARHFEKNFDFLPFGSITKIGHSGVDFFFVLSGFIIYFIHEKDLNKAAQIFPYLIKRSARIFPLYWFMFAATFAMIPLVSSATFPSLSNAFTQLLLFPVGMEHLLVGVSWTLQFEILFYLAFALLILNRTIGMMFGLFWFFLVVCHNFITAMPFEIPVIFSPFILQFFFGCLAGFFILNCNIAYNKTILSFGFVYLLGIYLLELNGLLNGYGKFARLHYGMAFTLIVISLVNIEKQTAFKIPNILMLLGKSSYSIYLSHLFFSGIYYKLFEICGLLAVLPIALSATLIICVTVFSAILLSLWIELPLTKAMRNYGLSKNQQYENIQSN